LPGHTASQVSWYCRVFGTELGPMPLAALCEMVEAEVLGPEDQVRSSDRCYWQAVCKLTPRLTARHLIVVLAAHWTRPHACQQSRPGSPSQLSHDSFHGNPSLSRCSLTSTQLQLSDFD
jgi:hypothetical protein